MPGISRDRGSKNYKYTELGQLPFAEPKHSWLRATYFPSVMETNLMSEVTNPVEALFLRALEVPPAERGVFLSQQCGDDTDRLAQVRELLAAHEQTGSFVVDGQAGLAESSASTRIELGEAIGPYKLLQEIGEGGMGIVYMADQKEPIKRRVALKVIKPGMDSKQVLARFEAERQALAMMDHPNIAKVHEAGRTDSGLPYFVMELVKGVPITKFCDANRLSTKQRLELFVDVCKAVQHAHQKGIIHRDLKPSNVLVAKFDDQPVVKVIDFGVAKATNQELTERTMFTQFGQIVGTLEYMSPEQAQFNQLDIDTRSDIYSLGVLLYELLTGAPPFDRDRLRTAAFDEIVRIIREEEPPRPSARLSTLGKDADLVSQSRNTDVSTLGRLVRGDVDLIVMKAMEKDRSRRYESASGLAADLKRYLEGEPIEARAASWSYQLIRFAKRNRASIATTSLLALLFVFCVGLILKSIDADLARKKAVRSDLQHAALLMREITNAVFSQNLGRAETGFEKFESEQLGKARGLAVSDRTLQTLNAQIKLLSGDYEDAIDMLEDVRVGEYPNKLTVDSMLCLAYQRNGNEERHFDLLPEIRSQACKEFSDYLFRGYALTTFFAEEANDDLSTARAMDPSNHMAMILSSIAGVQSGAQNLEAEDGIKSLQNGIANLNAVRAYFPDNERVLASLLTGNLFLSLRLEEVGRTAEAEAARTQAALIASQLTSTSPDALEARSSLHLVNGDDIALQADYQKSLVDSRVANHQALQAAISAFGNGEGDRALKILQSTDKEFQASTKAFQVYVQLDHFRSAEDLQAAMNALDMDQNDTMNIYSVFDWTLYRLLNDQDGMKQSISGPLRYANKIGRTAWVNQLEFALGREIDPRTGSQNRFDQAGAWGYLAFDALAKGDRKNAKRYFDAVLETDYFESFMYSWATAFSEKLENDEWLPWLRE